MSPQTRSDAPVSDAMPARGKAWRMAKLRSFLPRFAILAVMAFGVLSRSDASNTLGVAEFDALYAEPLPRPEKPLRVFHLGHSLVSRDMPTMLAQLAPAGHRYESQLGWGTTLKAHWEPGETINGFATENNHPRYRAAREALQSGEYDVLVATEMVNLLDAIRYFQSSEYLGRWAHLAEAGNPDIRVFLYETWHQLDDPEGWLERLDLDLARYWEGEILRRTLASSARQRPIYVIPAGQVMARVVREIEAGKLHGLSSRKDLFSDQIHLNDLGAYLVALTHFAVIYQQSPEGLPNQLLRHDGTLADAPVPEAARRMQALVWEVVSTMPRTGVPQRTDR